MKKNDWIIPATVALYSFLFYEQTAGINFLLFTVSLLTGLLLKDRILVKSHYWKMAATGALLSAVCIVYYGNSLSVTANIISLSILSALSYRTNTSVVAAALFSFYSYSASAVFMIQQWSSRRSERLPLHSSSTVKKWMLMLIPLLITIIFFLMYRASNPLFNDFTKNINLDFISWSWITFTLGGLILLYGFFNHQKIKSLSDLDEQASNDLLPTPVKPLTLFGKMISLTDEEFSGILLFILLNSLLVIVNILDANFIFNDRSLPKGITYSQFVHQNTNMLITSILIAIAIILFYFRGAINFSAKSKTIKLLAYAWIIQNLFILLSTLFKNNMYVQEFGLTYKRIGVYVYLLLTGIGLATTFIKIMHKKTNAYLFRVNGWIFYSILITTAFVNWDGFITAFNFQKVKRIEPEYLLHLSNVPLPELYRYQFDSSNNPKAFPIALQPSDSNLWAYTGYDFDRNRDKQLYELMVSRQDHGWKSWNYSHETTYRELMILNRQQKIQKLNLAALDLTSLQPLKNFGTLTELNVSGNKIENVQELFFFLRLKRLYLHGNNLKHLKGIEAFKELEYLSIGENPISDYAPVYSLKKLKKLWVGDHLTNKEYATLQENLPNTSIIKQ